ncbi:hypothetical protein TIFTF001_039004 [Ficus carica]|uniref:Uncharacterized protein n=1 Tax=Ficus carica TaxID=3494 RepID=A0AA88E9Y7_FICCA|nr:hypothetical protein TIFTF001_039004 [Ficus carica]
MLVRTPTLHIENWTLTYVPIQAGEGLQLCPVREQHQGGHSKKGKCNSAYSIGFLVVTGCNVGLWIELEMDWPPQPLHSCAPGTVTHDKGPISKLRNEIVLAERKLTPYVYAVEYNIRQCPDGGQLDFGHSIHEQGKYNSAYGIGFVVYTCLKNAMNNAMVSSLAATRDTRWRAWTGGL